MKRLFLSILSLLLACAMTGCAKKDGGQAWDAGERPDGWPDCCSILNGSLRVALAANATTGYRWSFSLSGEDVLLCESEEYYPDRHEENQVGYGGTYVADFSPKADGAVRLTLRYARPWEKEAKKTVLLEVSVAEGKIVSVTEIK